MGKDLFINTTKDEILATGRETDLPKKIFVKRGERALGKDHELLGGLMDSYGFGDLGALVSAEGRKDGLGIRMEAGMDRDEVIDLC